MISTSLSPGDRVVANRHNNGWNGLMTGVRGTVVRYTSFGDVLVEFDNGRTQRLLAAFVDRLSILDLLAETAQ